MVAIQWLQSNGCNPMVAIQWLQFDGCKVKKISKFKFVVKTQFRCISLIFCNFSEIIYSFEETPSGSGWTNSFEKSMKMSIFINLCLQPIETQILLCFNRWNFKFVVQLVYLLPLQSASFFCFFCLLKSHFHGKQIYAKTWNLERILF